MYGHYPYFFPLGISWPGNSLQHFCSRPGLKWRICRGSICSYMAALQRRMWLKQCAVRMKTHFVDLVCHSPLFCPRALQMPVWDHMRLWQSLWGCPYLCLLGPTWIPSLSRLLLSSQAVHGEGQCRSSFWESTNLLLVNQSNSKRTVSTKALKPTGFYLGYLLL